MMGCRSLESTPSGAARAERRLSRGKKAKIDTLIAFLSPIVYFGPEYCYWELLFLVLTGLDLISFFFMTRNEFEWVKEISYYLRALWIILFHR